MCNVHMYQTWLLLLDSKQDFQLTWDFVFLPIMSAGAVAMSI